MFFKTGAHGHTVPGGADAANAEGATSRTPVRNRLGARGPTSRGQVQLTADMNRPGHRQTGTHFELTVTKRIIAM